MNYPAPAPDVNRKRQALDRAIDDALPHAGGRVRLALLKLRKELAELDAERGATQARFGEIDTNRP
jgi:hypothetical protein